MSETCLCKARGRNESALLRCRPDEPVRSAVAPDALPHPCPDRGAGTARDVASDIKRDVTYFSFEDT